MLGVEDPQQFVFLHHQKRGWSYGGCRAHPDGLARHASLAKKVAWAEHRHDGFLSGSVHHREFHSPLLDVHDSLRSFTLGVDGFTPAVFDDFSRHPCGIEKHSRTEGVAVSILSGFLWFHTQVGSPCGHGAPVPNFMLARGGPSKLYKRAHCLPLSVSNLWPGRREIAIFAGRFGLLQSALPHIRETGFSFSDSKYGTEQNLGTIDSVPTHARRELAWPQPAD